uniref:Choline/carnitine acyltransferase domain-containing protein n=1 Tax=Romanomermis culicivorax TaxID=13658 RepID=A0A915JVF9_ROMCU
MIACSTRSLRLFLKNELLVFPNVGAFFPKRQNFQSCDESKLWIKLPKPPVPELSQTLRKYLEYAQVITTSEIDFNKTKQFVKDFAKNEGPIMQHKLLEMSTEDNNWRVYAFVIDTVVQGELQPREKIAECVFNVLSKSKNYPDHYIALLTAVHRNKGAIAWKQLLLDKVNRESLYKIETSSFVICLDDNVDDLDLPPESPGSPGCCFDAAQISQKLQKHFEHRVGQMLHGDGVTKHTANRWFDKTLQFILDRHGHMGFNYEHSVAEGIVIINLAEHVCKYVCKYLNSNDHLRKSLVATKNAELLSWNISNDVKTMIQECKVEVDK